MIKDAVKTKDIFLSGNESTDKVDEVMLRIDKEQAALKKKLLEITKKIDSNSVS